MFTLKKIALIGVAGLAAFSMSCSDSDGTDPGGTFTKALTVGLDNDGYILLGGEITATQPSGVDALTTGANAVTAVKVTANGTAVADKNIIPAIELGAVVVLDGTVLTGVCGEEKGNKAFKVEVTATFKDGADLVGSGNATVDCGTEKVDPALVKTPITLSAAGSSYADLDGTPAIYKQAQAADIKNKIDLVAYNGQVGESENVNAIYSPTELDFFYSEDFSTYYGGDVVFYVLPAEGVAVLNNATKLSQVEDFTGTLEAFIDTAPEVTEISIVKGTGFLVSTSEGNILAVIITDAGVQTVDLTAIAFPEDSTDTDEGARML